MKEDEYAQPNRIRMVFELARADNPRLFDELSQFPQGPRRVNRLRVLAYDGLLVQCGVLAFARLHEGPASGVAEGVVRRHHVTDQLFEPGIEG
jgi:hypothetical protein